VTLKYSSANTTSNDRISQLSTDLPKDLAISQVFEQCFGESFNTVLQRGADEPLYTPAINGSPAVIHYRADYETSLLHEVAHWCVAGKQRRMLEDYGYWYEPDGRNQEQQAMFAKVEARPQAVEWFLSSAADIRFRVSLDNLSQGIDDAPFKDAVYQQMLMLLDGAIPPRALQFAKALAEVFDGRILNSSNDICREQLDSFGESYR